MRVWGGGRGGETERSTELIYQAITWSLFGQDEVCHSGKVLGKAFFSMSRSHEAEVCCNLRSLAFW